jgi:hypothetical protein
LKDNKPLMAGPRFQTYFDQGSKTAVLRIADISKDEQGYYTCIVDNPFNSDQSTATLQVIPETKIDQRSYVETDAFKYLTPENKPLRTANKDIDRPTSGVDRYDLLFHCDFTLIFILFFSSSSLVNHLLIQTHFVIWKLKNQPPKLLKII